MKIIRKCSGRPKIIRNDLKGRPKKQYNTIEEIIAQLSSEETICPSIQEALSGPNASDWFTAMKSEYESLVNNNTWIKVPRPENRNIIGCKWVLHNKYNADGTINKRKARLVAKGYPQIPGIDYDETFAPVARLGSIRIIMALAAQYKLKLYQLYVVMAYINGELDEEIYMSKPDEFIKPGEENLVCLLKKSLYGLK